MRLRKKAWALPEMAASAVCCLKADERRGAWADWFEKPEQPLALELGCGKGRFLYEIAEARPDMNFIGVDVEANAMIAAKRQIEARKLGNARLLRQDISVIGGLFDKDSVDELFIHFCNPWPKKRHRKRRLTHPRQLTQYHTFLKEGAVLNFKTDDTDLYEASLEYLPAFGFEIISATPDLPLDEDPTGIITEYEERWRGMGIPIKAIRARRLAIPEEALRAKLEAWLAARKAAEADEGDEEDEEDEA